jgi:hypothetical protein
MNLVEEGQMAADFPCTDQLNASSTFSDLTTLKTGNDNIINSSISITSTTTTAALSTAAQTRMTALKPTKPALSENLSTYITVINSLNDKIKIEYCHYYRRYYVAVNSFLQSLIDDTRTNATTYTTAQTNNLNNVLLLNNRLTFLTLFTNKLTNAYAVDGVDYNTTINSLNEQMNLNKTQLDAQKAKFESSNMNLEANRRMVEFTQEKNRANSNLLAMYAVLNVAAFAMLVYIART